MLFTHTTPAFDLRRNLQRHVHALAPHARRQSVRRVIRQLHRFAAAFETSSPPAPAQKFPAAPPPTPAAHCSTALAGNTILAPASPSSGCQHVAPSATPCFTKPINALQLHARHDRSDIDRLVQRRPNAQRAHPPPHFLRSIFPQRFPAPAIANPRNTPAPDSTRSRRPTLRPRCRDPHLQKSRTETSRPAPAKAACARRRRLSNRAAHFRRSRERNLVHVGVLHQRFARRSVAGHDIHHARRQPTSLQISANASAVSGVNSAGFSTTVFPAASAGAIFHASINNGKFHGMICPTTPHAHSQEIPTPQSAPNPRDDKNAAPPAEYPYRGSRESACRCRSSPAPPAAANVSALAAPAHTNFEPAHARSMLCQPANAPRAAATAASTSAARTLRHFRNAHRPSKDRVVSKYLPSAGSLHSPPIKCPNFRSCPSSHCTDSFAILRRRPALHRHEFFNDAHLVIRSNRDKKIKPSFRTKSAK